VSAETWISVDVETSGPAPSVASLLSIGACLVGDPDRGIELLVRDVQAHSRVGVDAVHPAVAHGSKVCPLREEGDELRDIGGQVCRQDDGVGIFGKDGFAAVGRVCPRRRGGDIESARSLQKLMQKGLPARCDQRLQ